MWRLEALNLKEMWIGDEVKSVREGVIVILFRIFGRIWNRGGGTRKSDRWDLCLLHGRPM